MDKNILYQYLVNQKHTASTVKSYLFIIERYLKQHPKAAQYGYKEIMNYFKQVLLTRAKRPGVILLQAGIKKYYDFLLYSGKINQHPCRSIFIKHRNKNLIHQDLFTRMELEGLLKRQERYAMLKYRNRLVISLLIYQGLSSSEITQLKIQHINLDQPYIKIIGNAYARHRVLDLRPSQVNLIEKYLHQNRKHLMKEPIDALLLNKMGNPITVDDIHYLIETYKFLYPDRKLTPQTIRQSVIANWLNEYQIPLEDVQVLAGHKLPSATLKYRQAPIKHAVDTLNLYQTL